MSEPFAPVRDPNTLRSDPYDSASRAEFVGEVADLAVGAGILTFTLAPFALPALALIALTAAVLLIPALAVALLLAPFLVARGWWRSRDRAAHATRSGPPRWWRRGL